MFAYNKNYMELPGFSNQKVSYHAASDKNSMQNESDASKYRTFTLDFIFKKLIDYSEDQAVIRVR